MHELWSSASYDAHLLSLPFAFAPAAMIVVIAYAIAMRGEPVLRAWMLLHFVSLMPYSICMAMSPSVTSPAAAEQLFRVAAAFLPMAAASGLGFQLRLLRIRSRLVWVGVAVALAWVITDAVTNAAVDGVYRLDAGLWYANAGPLAWLTLVSIIIISTPGFVLMSRAARRNKPSVERRQLRSLLLASLITYSGLIDVTLAWHVGVFPLGWLLSGLGSVLVVRALIFEDLLRVRAVDDTAPRVLLHLVLAVLLGWVSLAQLGPALRWWAAALVMACVFAGVRVTVSVFKLISRGGRTAESTLDRLVNQLAIRARTSRDETEVARLAIDVIQLGSGVRADVLIAAAEDYGWTTATGQRLDDAGAPDPLLGAWLAEHPGAVYADAPAVPDDLRPLLAGVLSRAQAATLVPVISRDELLALILVPALARRQRRRAVGFVERAAERLGEGLVHVRLAQRAADRASLAREVELAATVQAQLLPGRGPHVHGDVTVVGSWQPATRCAGDFWGFYPLGPHRLLLAIGDVTGHGVASATVTAAAVGACDVAVRRHGAALDLGTLVGSLDLAVARVGGGQLAMTLFAAIIDGEARTISYVSCGHTAPYVVHAPSSGPIELHALVGRGNPLGGGSSGAPKVQQRPLRAGDLLVWYTDGVIEAQDPAGEPFGDRRLQRLLRRLDLAALAPPAVHDLVHASVAAHRAGRPRADDETLVVAQWSPPPAASIEPAQRISSP
ncbi:MAG: SpoIIE family protein phosphatase [Deltaproteobacteria bacterium]